MSERTACRVLGQHRSTQRKARRTADDEAALTQAVVELATQYGRYDYRRITALLHAEGWACNHKRVERIWRLEGLKVPARQPKRGRLWLNDGSCVRLRPERANHVWAYDFVEDRTHDGRKFRMLNAVDEFTRECLTIWVGRKLKASDVIDVLADLFIVRGVPGHIRSDNGSEFTAVAAKGWITGVHANTAYIEPGTLRWHSSRCAAGTLASSAHGKWVCGKLQRQAQGRAAQHGGDQHPGGSKGADRAVAQALQHDPATLLTRLPAARAGGLDPQLLAGWQVGAYDVAAQLGVDLTGYGSRHAFPDSALRVL